MGMSCLPLDKTFLSPDRRVRPDYLFQATVAQLVDQSAIHSIGLETAEFTFSPRAIHMFASLTTCGAACSRFQEFHHDAAAVNQR